MEFLGVLFSCCKGHVAVLWAFMRFVVKVHEGFLWIWGFKVQILVLALGAS